MKFSGIVRFIKYLLCVALLMGCVQRSISVHAADPVYMDLPVKVVYFQSESRAGLAGVNRLRTGSDAWYWNSDNTTKTVLSDLPVLQYDYDLEKVAMQRCAESAVFWSHQRPDGLSCYQTYRDMGYYYSGAAENIAIMSYHASYDYVQEMWEEADEDYSGQGHRRNLLDPDFKAFATACVYYEGWYYWVQEFSTDPVNTTPTDALDGEKTVSVHTDCGYISDWSLSNDSITMDPGEKKMIDDCLKINYLMGKKDYYPARYSYWASEYITEWESSDPDVVRVVQGELQAMSPGNAVLSASVPDGKKTFSVNVTVTGNYTVQPPVIQLSGMNTSGVMLTWDEVRYADQYAVFRKEGYGQYQKIDTVAETECVDRTAAAGKKYTYAVQTYNESSGDYSDYSNEIPVIFNPFCDVKTSDNYFNSLAWAYNSGIVSGTSADTFSPEASCTRAQMAVMLWRLNGKPAVTGNSTFKDISSLGPNAKKGIEWCYEEGIVGGYENGTLYKPDDPVTRAQMAVMLWRMAGKPAPKNQVTPFTDLGNCGSQAKKAIAWAYENGITKGTSATTFGPDNPCLRKQLVIFLKRMNDIYYYIW